VRCSLDLELVLQVWGKWF